MRVQFVIALLAVFVVSTSAASARKWTDSTGKYTVEAELVHLKDGIVQLKRSDDGRLIPVALSSLSSSDREYVKQVQNGPSETTDKVSRVSKPRYRTITADWQRNYYAFVKEYKNIILKDGSGRSANERAQRLFEGKAIEWRLSFEAVRRSGNHAELEFLGVRRKLSSVVVGRNKAPPPPGPVAVRIEGRGSAADVAAAFERAQKRAQELAQERAQRYERLTKERAERYRKNAIAPWAEFRVAPGTLAQWKKLKRGTWVTVEGTIETCIADMAPRGMVMVLVGGLRRD